MPQLSNPTEKQAEKISEEDKEFGDFEEPKQINEFTQNEGQEFQNQGFEFEFKGNKVEETDKKTQPQSWNFDNTGPEGFGDFNQNEQHANNNEVFDDFAEPQEAKAHDKGAEPHKGIDDFDDFQEISPNKAATQSPGTTQEQTKETKNEGGDLFSYWGGDSNKDNKDDFAWTSFGNQEPSQASQATQATNSNKPEANTGGGFDFSFPAQTQSSTPFDVWNNEQSKEVVKHTEHAKRSPQKLPDDDDFEEFEQIEQKPEEVKKNESQGYSPNQPEKKSEDKFDDFEVFSGPQAGETGKEEVVKRETNESPKDKQSKAQESDDDFDDFEDKPKENVQEHIVQDNKQTVKDEKAAPTSKLTIYDIDLAGLDIHYR